MRITRIMLAGILLILAACGTPAPTTTTPAPTTPASPEPTTPATPPATPPTATPPTPAPPLATPPATPPAVQGPYDVWLPVGREFRPNILTLPVGTKVTWTNKDAEPHTVTSDTGLFDASLALGGSFSYTFTERGTFNYHCDLHLGMDGKVIVQ